jgi:hypothetical protein
MIPTEVLDAMHTRYQDGVGFRRIATEFGYARSTIRRAFQRRDWIIRPSAAPLAAPVQHEDGYWLIPLAGKDARGRAAIVDDEDYAAVAGYRWRLWERETTGRTNGPYARARLNMPDGSTPTVFMHKLLTGQERTDHWNSNGLDNRRSNLRAASVAENNHNQRPHALHSSRYKGVTWHRGLGKWQASIKVDGKYRYLGVFVYEEDAGQAYDVAAHEAYGPYAYLNFARPA